MEEKIITLVSEQNLCLTDDYLCKIEIDGIIYPSVRHAVLSWKTDNSEIKLLISRSLPADLKDVENSIIDVSENWSINFIMNLFEKYTLYKFENNVELAKKLLNTDNKEFDLQTASFFINELRPIKNYEGIVLTLVRKSLQKNLLVT